MEKETWDRDPVARTWTETVVVDDATPVPIHECMTWGTVPASPVAVRVEEPATPAHPEREAMIFVWLTPQGWYAGIESWWPDHMTNYKATQHGPYATAAQAAGAAAPLFEVWLTNARVAAP